MGTKQQTRQHPRRTRLRGRRGERELEASVAAPTAQQLKNEWTAEIAQFGEVCTALVRELHQSRVPELETLIQLYRLLILKFCLEARNAPGLFQLLCTLMKPVLEWARLEEKRKKRELAEQKYRDSVNAQKAARANAGGDQDALTAETLEKIQREVKLL